jgi:hypothetical protein
MVCLERAEAAFALAAEQVLPFWAATAAIYSGWALVKKGQAKEGLARLRSGLDTHRGIGAEPQSLALLAEACLASDRIEEGLSAVHEALAEVEEMDARSGSHAAPRAERHRQR